MKHQLIAGCLFLSAGFFSASAQVMTPEFLMSLGRLSEPKIAPDGKSVVYTVRNYSIPDNKGNADIFKTDIAGTTVTPLANSAANEFGAKWMPDGSKILYMQGGQIWEMLPDGSQKKQISAVEAGISGFGISPKGNYIWFFSDVKLDKTPAELYPDLPKVSDARIIDGLMYRHWDSWHDYAYSHLFVAQYANGKLSNIRDLVEGERVDVPLPPMGGEEQVGFSPDEKFVAYTSKKLQGTNFAMSTNSDIYVYDLTQNTTQNVSTANPGYDVNPRFSPDGALLMWLSMETPKYEADRNRIMILNRTTNQLIEASAGFKYSVNKAEWGSNNFTIYFLAGINATEQLYVYDGRLKMYPPIRQITNEMADITDFDMSFAGKIPACVVTKMSISQPTELYSVDVAKGGLTAISHVNDAKMASVKLGKVEKRMVTTTDGQQMLTWVIYPPDFDPTKKYPTLLYCQGGPQSTVSQFFSFRWNFQLMAANGYIVVAPNRRGLPSFGEEWNEQITGDWGGQAMQDLLSAIDDVSKESYVDKDRRAAVGASFGGYSVYWLAGNHQGRFKSFIAHCGVFNLESMYGTTEEMFFSDFEFGGPYWNSSKPKSYDAFSPHKFVQNWNTPMLVIHNERDFRVPLSQGMEAFTAAQLKGIPSRFLYFPDEGHWVSKPQNSILWQRVYFEWLSQTLK